MAIQPALSPWLPFSTHLPAGSTRLFCFPFAGGGAAYFRPWLQRTAPSLSVLPVQLPGREGRLREPAYNRLEALIPALAKGLAPWLTGRFAFFGYSMGGLIAFELTRYLRRHGGQTPAQLFIGAAPSPRRPHRNPQLPDLPEADLIADLRRLGGTPDWVLNQPELLQIILPLLRADFAVCTTYQYSTEPPLTLPLTIWGGDSDSQVPPEALADWALETTGPVEIHQLPGEHFFLNQHGERVLGQIERALSLPSVPR